MYSTTGKKEQLRKTNFDRESQTFIAPETKRVRILVESTPNGILTLFIAT